MLDDTVRQIPELAAHQVVEAKSVNLEYFDTPQAARYLGVSTQYLEIARHKGEGPPYYKLSRAVRYKRSELDQWMLAHRRFSEVSA